MKASQLRDQTIEELNPDVKVVEHNYRLNAGITAAHGPAQTPTR